MRASRLNLAKDLLSTLLLVVFVLAAVFGLIPSIQDHQAAVLRAQYIDEQRRLVSQAVVNAGERILRMERVLPALGLDPRKAQALILQALGSERFGLNGYGYFFIFDRDGTMLLHPVFPELEGRKLDSILSADGANMGKVFSAVLDQADSGFATYLWAAPGMLKAEPKTSFALRIRSLGWTIVSGFYDSDLEASLAAYTRIAGETQGRIQATALGLLGACLVVLIVLSRLAQSRIKGIEGRLRMQILNLEQYKLILDESSIVSRTDTCGVINYVNDKFTQVTGHSREAALGHKHNIERHPDTPLAVFRDLWETSTSGRVWDGVIKNLKADGTSYYKHATIVPLLDESGRIVEYLSSGQDVTAILEGRRALERAFLTDPLTGLGSRIRLLRDLEDCGDASVALLDIEGFSALNQAFGSSEGDLVLKQLASRLLDFGRAQGMSAYRIWADTFALLEPSEGRGDFGEKVTGLAVRLGSESFDMGGNKVPLIVHAGISIRGKDPFLYADLALKRAKASHRMVSVFGGAEAEAPGDSLGNLRILASLHEALERDRIYPVFQPILDVASGRIGKYECLMRIEDAEGGTIMPDAFIQISKKTNLYRRLTHSMLEKSIEAFRHLDHEFSINLTVEDLMTRETIDYLVEEAELKGVSGRLFAEIVETEELRDLPDALVSIDRLRQAGMGIAVDDFGSGYSNFEYLLKLKPDYIKIDRVIIQNLLADDRARDMLASIVGFAGKSGIRTIAEYVDSQALMDEVVRQGVGFVQGWFVGKASRTI